MRKLYFTAVALLFSAPMGAFAQISVGDTGLQETGTPIYGSATPDIGTYIANFIIKPAFGVIGLLFFILMVYAGFLWMTAAGNDAQVTKAKQILTNSVIGTFVVIVAYAVTSYLVSALAG